MGRSLFSSSPHRNDIVKLIKYGQFEKAMGMPALPDDPDARREAFNAGLVEVAKQLPPTDSDIDTR